MAYNLRLWLIKNTFFYLKKINFLTNHKKTFYLCLQLQVKSVRTTQSISVPSYMNISQTENEISFAPRIFLDVQGGRHTPPNVLKNALFFCSYWYIYIILIKLNNNLSILKKIKIKNMGYFTALLT